MIIGTEGNMSKIEVGTEGEVTRLEGWAANAVVALIVAVVVRGIFGLVGDVVGFFR